MNHVIDWEIKDPATVGMLPDKLKELDNALNFQLGIIHGIAVVRKGSVVYEKYFRGFDAQNSHDLTSVTQCIMSALIGIAIDKGHIQSVDQKVLDFFPDASSRAGDVLKRSLTIKHLLTMTVPYGWKGSEPLDRLRRQKNWTLYILDTVASKGKAEFQYSLASAHLLSAILTKSTGLSAREFAIKHLFQPLGIREIADQKMKSFSKDDVFGNNLTGWIKDPQDFNTGGWGLTLTLRDLVRFGQLYLNRGKWEDKQIISDKWIEESIKQHSEDFGYLWWLREDKGIESYFGVGIGGTYLYCIPEKELVVTILSKSDKMIIDRWELLENYIIPAIEQ
ncbi:serine hydrolase domain-containing protein [Paenibacillus sp. JSM ZJ436]|uniref:serine hydrolase domain-containing protein n=1 Tax=Paenibacillus sp. JSM ZJ436 TaxID=3376190 RepID=UPI0037A6E77D